MVANNIELKNAIENGKLEIIKYEWNGSLSKQSLQYADLEGSHKIRLHVGFLLRTLSHKRWINPKWLYNDHDGIIDLRKTPNRTYILYPGESVIMYTNEVVRVNSDYFGILLSKVKHEENGLRVSQSYVDPNWKGVLQLIVTNNSEYKQELREHCEIANLVLMGISTQANVPPQPHNSHFAIDWQMIFDNPRYPKWQDRKRSMARKVWHGIHTRWYLFTTIGVVGIIANFKNIIDLFINIFKFFNT